MNKTEAGLLKDLGETVTRLNNLKVPIVVGWVKGGKELKTMGSRHLTNKFESEFRNGRGWERAFDEDKTEMMGLPDNSGPPGPPDPSPHPGESAGYHGEQHGLDVSVEPAQSAGETEERPEKEKEDINGNKGTSTS